MVLSFVHVSCTRNSWIALRWNHAGLCDRLTLAWPDVRAIDFMNLTENAQLSDGVHYRTDVNLAKAHVVLRLMELVAEEGVAKLRAEEGPPRAWQTLSDDTQPKHPQPYTVKCSLNK